jgi:hypothetical protein
MDQSHTSNVEELLAEVVEAHEGRALSLQVWSSKRAELRGTFLRDLCYVQPL